MAKYTLIVESNSSLPREYDVETRNARLLAAVYGRAEGGETITVYSSTGKPLSRVIWDVERRKYIYVTI